MTTRNLNAPIAGVYRQQRWPHVLQHAASAPLSATTAAAPTSPAPPASTAPDMASHPYLGMWVTDSGHVRHQLLPGGRYDEPRGDLESAYRGCYAIEGNHIEYVDDTGFTADGDFVDGVLHHAGMVLRRTTSSPVTTSLRAE